MIWRLSMKRSSHFLYRFLWGVLSHRDLLRPGDHCPLQATNHSTDSTASLCGRKIQYRSLQLYRHIIYTDMIFDFWDFRKCFATILTACHGSTWSPHFQIFQTQDTVQLLLHLPLWDAGTQSIKIAQARAKDAWARLPRNMKRANDDNRCVPSSLCIDRPRRHPMTPTIQTLKVLRGCQFFSVLKCKSSSRYVTWWQDCPYRHLSVTRKFSN